jgi:DNA-binding transcriptional MocR family regulator
VGRLYQRLAEELGALIEDGTLPPGTRLPSVRTLCASRQVSPATATGCYRLLEERGLVRARPRSGYFVLGPAPRAELPRPARLHRAAAAVSVSDLVFATLDASARREVVPLGSAFPDPAHFPWRELARFTGSAARGLDPWETVASVPQGSAALRRQIAQRYVRQGCRVSADDILVTNGALEALTVTLQALTRPGDAVAIESPAFYGCLQAIEMAGLRAVEIPTDPATGIDISALADAVRRHGVKVCWVMTRYHNPTGASLPEARVRELVALAEARGFLLLEDDVYAELGHAALAGFSAKAIDRRGVVLSCSSFSKCLAPGYRVGWVAAPRRFMEVLRRRKISTSLGTSLPAQEGVALYLREGRFDAHLANLRASLAAGQVAAVRSLRRHFGERARISVPRGGYFLWIELPPGSDALRMHTAALAQNISIAPGPMFSPRRRFRNYLRLNCGHRWTAALDAAVARLARLSD